jgi:hypothetical protein
MIAVRNNVEINTKIMNHSRTQTYHLKFMWHVYKYLEATS